MSWQQYIVNAQVSVNRAVFELNKVGFPKGHKLRKEENEIDHTYISECIQQAIKELNEARKKLNPQKEIEFK